MKFDLGKMRFEQKKLNGELMEIRIVAPYDPRCPPSPQRLKGTEARLRLFRYCFALVSSTFDEPRWMSIQAILEAQCQRLHEIIEFDEAQKSEKPS